MVLRENGMKSTKKYIFNENRRIVISSLDSPRWRSLSGLIKHNLESFNRNELHFKRIKNLIWNPKMRRLVILTQIHDSEIAKILKFRDNFRPVSFSKLGSRPMIWLIQANQPIRERFPKTNLIPRLSSRPPGLVPKSKTMGLSLEVG